MKICHEKGNGRLMAGSTPQHIFQTMATECMTKAMQMRSPIFSATMTDAASPQHFPEIVGNSADTVFSVTPVALEKVFIILMYGAGTRCDETCSLKVRNIHFNNGGGAHVDIINGKGGKSRSVWISEPCARIIKGYIHYRRLENQPEAFLFKSQTHEKMSVSAIEEVYKKYIVKAKKEHPDKFKAGNYTPHTMRRTTASHMLESGIEMEVIRTFLGHSSVYTTSLYAVLSQQKMDRDLKNWAAKWFPEEKAEEETCTTSNVPDFLR